jgi:Ca2+-binding EF-hand superfamily protein
MLCLGSLLGLFVAAACDRVWSAQMFADFDADGSGELDYEEVRQLSRVLGLAAVDPLEVMQGMDADGSGAVTFEEFFAWYVREFVVRMR